MLRNKMILILLIGMMGSRTLSAQTDFWTAAQQADGKWAVDNAKAGWFPLQMLNDDKQYIVTYTGKQINLIVPAQLSYSYLYVEIRGGDGGARANHSLANPLLVAGGEGATMKAYYRIGTGANQLKNQDNLRLILGSKGAIVESAGTRGANGGAGTGLFLNKKGTDSWVTLMVAGGGGGAYSDCCSVTSVGRSASTSPNGRDGGGDFPKKGGTNGGDGESPTWEFHAFGGGGVNNAWADGEPAGSTDSNEDTESFLYGCGHGGYGNLGGGGGGGYSGGGAGRNYAGGGGGGSYYNPDRDFLGMTVTANGQTNNPQNGYAIFQFTNEPPFPAIKFALNTNKCIDDYASKTDNGTNIRTYTCNGNDNQMWFFNPEGRTVQLPKHLNKCLDLSSGNTTNGTNIQLWDCTTNNPNQKWVYNGVFKTIHSGINSGKCLDAASASGNPSANVNVQLWDCLYSNNQKWNIAGATTVSNPATVKRIIPVLAPNFAVHSHTGAEWGSNIQLWTKDDTNEYEQWYFDGLAIKMRNHQELCIDLNSSNTNNGNNIQLWGCNNTNAQKWIYDGMMQSIRSVINPDKCMQIEYNTDGVYGKRANVDIHDCNGSAAQQFLIQE
ncbi:MAG: ricin-type beta-trefoil lectin domain protein [Lewinellaceae bacterium]|nr:ricin-type beta-trefoil lectin domain protein [Lewinellaceae bacterium]